LWAEASEKLATLAGSSLYLIGAVALGVAVLVKFFSAVFDEEVSVKTSKLFSTMCRSAVAVVVDVTGAIVSDVAAWTCQLA
jgi:hypothetical protein